MGVQVSQSGNTWNSVDAGTKVDGSPSKSTWKPIDHSPSLKTRATNSMEIGVSQTRIHLKAAGVVEVRGSRCKILVDLGKLSVRLWIPADSSGSNRKFTKFMEVGGKSIGVRYAC